MPVVNNWFEQAQEVVDQIYQITADLNYADNNEDNDEAMENDITAYVEMVNKREQLVEKLLSIGKNITPTDRETTEYNEIMSCIKDIADMEHEHTQYYEKLRDELRGAIKEVKSGRKLINAYNPDTIESAMYFDTKK